jgi:hypothetical protein
MRTVRLSRSLFVSVATLFPIADATAQCATEWLTGQAITGVNGTANATLVRSNGEVVVGGAFETAGGHTVHTIALAGGVPGCDLLVVPVRPRHPRRPADAQRHRGVGVLRAEHAADHSA